MPTTLEQIQRTAKRIERLGKYLVGHHNLSASKKKGELTMKHQGGETLHCIPLKGRVWKRTWVPFEQDEADLSLEDGLKHLLDFELWALDAAAYKARKDILDELVAKRLKKVLKSKKRVQQLKKR